MQEIIPAGNSVWGGGLFWVFFPFILKKEMREEILLLLKNESRPSLCLDPKVLQNNLSFSFPSSSLTLVSDF